MDFTCKTRAVSSFAKDVKSGKYNMHHKLQRKEGQWSNAQRGELIDSILRSYPIDPIRAEVKSDDIKYVFDGVQRSTNLCGYIQKEYRLPKFLKPVVIDGVEYEICGKKFDQLDEPVQDKIKNSEIQVYMFTNCTEDDIREMYRRQNNGKSLSNTQKRTAKEPDELSEIIFSLADHPFFNKLLSPTQIKRDLSRDLMRETLMLIETNNENDYTSFRSKDIDNFIMNYIFDNEKKELIEQALNKFDEAFSADEKVSINSLSVPMILYSGYRVLKDKKSFAKLIDIIRAFIENYDGNEEYKQFCNSGTSSSDKVRGRLDYWRGLIKAL